MGHTVWSQRIVCDIILSELKAYGKALRGEDRIIYERLLKEPLKHFGSISYANSIHAWAFLLLSIMIEQKKNESLVDGCLEKREPNYTMD